MTRTKLFLALGLAALVLAPLASAQQQGVLTLRVSTPTSDLRPDTSLAVAGVATLYADPTVAAQLSGVPVRFFITKLPNGTTATISPATDVFEFGPQVATTWESTRPFQVIVYGTKDLPADTFDVVEVTAVTTPSFGGNYFSAKVMIPLHLVNGDTACPPANATPATAPPPAPAPTTSATKASANASATPVHVQSTAPAATFPVAPAAAIGGFAVVGAAVGLLVRRRR
jgi:hypothetical protein